MADIAAAPVPVSPTIPAPLPIKAIMPWAVFFGLLMLLAVYFVGADQGATSVFGGSFLHEWVHDGRHLLGFPCH